MHSAFKKYGIAAKFVTSDDPTTLAAAIDENTKAVYVESIRNPKYNVSPINEIAKVCNMRAFVPVPLLRCDVMQLAHKVRLQGGQQI